MINSIPSRLRIKGKRLLPIKINLVFIVLLFGFHFSGNLSAQDYILNLQQYGIEEGLSHRQVNCVVKDDQGFLWLGTPFGLNRFDGYEFEWWTKEKNGLPNNYVQNLAIDAAGDLWIIQSSLRIGFYNSQSISILDTKQGTLKTIEEKLGEAMPVPVQDVGGAILKDKESVLYFGTGNGARMLSYHPDDGLQVFPLDTFKNFMPRGITTGQTIWGIANGDHLIEVSTEGQILQTYHHPINFSWRNVVVIGNEVFFEGNKQNNTITFFKIDENGQLHEFTDEELPISTAQLDHKIKQLNYDPHQERLWMVSKELLPIVNFEQGKLLDFYDEYPHLVRDRGIGWRGILFEPSGDTWLGGDFGLYHINIHPNKFSRYLFEKDWGTSEGEANNISCRGIFINGDKLYINTERYGLHTIDVDGYFKDREASTKAFDVRMTPQMRSAYALLNSKRDMLWIGQYGLQQFDKETEILNKLFANAPNKALEVIWTIYEDRRSILWLGGSIGLEYFDPQSNTLHLFEKYNEFQILAESEIMHIGEDRNGHIWICSNTGLYTLDINAGITARYWSGGTGEYYFPHDKYYHFHHDKDDVYWLATAGGGMIRWDKANKQVRQFTKVDGLSNNVIYAIYEGNHGHLWMSSDYGIIQFDKKTYQSQAYLREDGITHNEFNRISHFQAADGRIYFGGLNGVTAFHPDDFHQFDTLNNAPLQITEFQQFDGTANQLIDKLVQLRQQNEIRLKPNDRFFRLGFSLLTYEAPQQIQYAYKIEGVDKDWAYQREPFIRMGRLPYGRHTLKIKGQAANGQWSSQVLSIPVISIRPFYLQNWFLLLAGLVLLGIIFLGFKWRTWKYKQEQQRLEEEVARQTATIREQSQKLKELDALKSRFYTNITHEFRTPLTVIMGVVENIKGYLKERQLIRRNSENLLRLVNELLDLSKLESGTLKLDEVQGDIINYLRYLTESFYSLAEERKLRLTFYSEESELIMDYDEEKVQHIIYNLLSNALKFTNKGGKVILHTRKMGDEEKPFLQLKIQDTGIGIPPKELPYIFNRFYQADGSTTRKGEGTGIGLSLTKELITLMEGKIQVKSVLGQGTEFTVILPIHRKTGTIQVDKKLLASPKMSEGSIMDADASIEPAEEEAALVTENDDKPLLLIIEDNQDVITYIKSILTKNYQVSTAEDGQAGIDSALEIIPDIIITDVMMPQKDGYEVCAALKSDERTSHIPIVMLTAKATASDRIAGLKTGADAYLMKPFDKEELFVRLEKLIELRKALQKKYALSLSADAFRPGDDVVDKEPDLNDLFIQKIQKVIDEKMDDAELGILDLCRAVQLSHTQVYRKVKALTGDHPTGFIRKARLKKAKELLLTTDLNISEIAYDVGFTDPNYFSRAFSQEFRLSPSAMRKRM
ncbi:MAG: hybrid sensor histidine kinase/response regulator [Bacteroidetes bacterium]|nr:MAG: hybrid sensor histidine kinase/response regulator [Bacteroidota bacterium]